MGLRLSDEILLETIEAFKKCGTNYAAARLAKVPYATFQNRIAQARMKFPNMFDTEDSVSDRKSTRPNSSHIPLSRMPSSA